MPHAGVSSFRHYHHHPELVTVLRARLESRAVGALVFAAARGEGLRTSPSGAVRRLWEAATAAGEVREWVWKPRNRGKTRPDHAFRAGFLGALRGAGVVAEVRHALVGHAAESTEARHYSGVTDSELRRGIEALPGIDWVGLANVDRGARIASNGVAAD